MPRFALLRGDCARGALRFVEPASARVVVANPRRQHYALTGARTPAYDSPLYTTAILHLLLAERLPSTIDPPWAGESYFRLR
jgi:hypothetical protein